MKNTQSLSRIALLALALGTASATAFAQTGPASTTPASTTPATTAPTGKDKHDKEAVLTADEKAHLAKVRTEALAANPDLQTEVDSLKAQHKAMKKQGTASDEDKKALKAQIKENEDKVKIAMLKIDPTVEPIFAKLKAAHKEKKAASASA